MTVRSNKREQLSTGVTPLPRIAYWTSQIAVPPLLSLAAWLLCGLLVGSPGGWLWVGGAIAVGVITPALYIVRLYQRGLVGDLHLRRREERIRPTLVAIGCMLLLSVAALVGEAPPLVALFALFQTVQTILFLLITFVWKISAHAGNAGMLATVASWFLGPPALLLWALVLLVAWSRITLRRHTPAQTVAGAALGTATTLLALLLL